MAVTTFPSPTMVSTVLGEMNVTTNITTTTNESSSTNQLGVVSGVQAGQILIGFLGVVGNLICIVVLLRRSAQTARNNTNILIVNQALVDCIASALLVANILSSIGGIASVPKTQLGITVYCNLWDSKLLIFAGFAISTFNLVALSIERYLAVIHPVWYLQNFKKRVVYVLMTLTWVLGPIFQIIIVVLHYDSTPEGLCVYTPRYKSVLVILFLWDYFIPAAIMAFSFAAILLKFRQLNKIAGERTAGAETTRAYRGPPGGIDMQPTSALPSTSQRASTGDSGIDNVGTMETAIPGQAESPLRHQSDDIIRQPGTAERPIIKAGNVKSPPTQSISQPPPQNAASLPSQNAAPVSSQQNAALPQRPPRENAAMKAGKLQRRSTTKVLLVMYVMYLICWSPNQWTFLYFNLGGYFNLNSAWYRFLLIMANLNTCVNPFIFALRLKVYRQEVQTMCASFFRRCVRN